MAVLAGPPLLWLLSFLALSVFNPITTGVQLQRRVEAWLTWTPYDKAYRFVPMEQISPHLQHALIAGEDTRFYQHGGIDWEAVEEVIEDSWEEGRLTRGGSTITQQLTKNLWFTTHGNPLRKVAEFAIAPALDRYLGKKRVLELYLNVIEFGPGIFGAEAASRHYFKVPASRLTRDQAIRLAAIVPAPLRRKVNRPGRYARTVETRMRQMGW